MDDVHSYYEFIVCVMLFDLRFRFDFVAPSTFFAGYLSCLFFTCQTIFFFFLLVTVLVMLCVCVWDAIACDVNDIEMR